jgi:hypothetical protein
LNKEKASVDAPERERKRLGEERGAHRGDRNRAATFAGKRGSDEQNRTARRHFAKIERWGIERASRGFYRHSGLERGLGFRGRIKRPWATPYSGWSPARGGRRLIGGVHLSAWGKRKPAYRFGTEAMLGHGPYLVLGQMVSPRPFSFFFILFLFFFSIFPFVS